MKRLIAITLLLIGTSAWAAPIDCTDPNTLLVGVCEQVNSNTTRLDGIDSDQLVQDQDISTLQGQVGDHEIRLGVLEAAGGPAEPTGGVLVDSTGRSFPIIDRDGDIVWVILPSLTLDYGVQLKIRGDVSGTVTFTTSQGGICSGNINASANNASRVTGNIVACLQGTSVYSALPGQTGSVAPTYVNELPVPPFHWSVR